jgi:hypothetical protein
MLAPTLAVALTWFVAAAVLLGVGYACRQLLIRVFRYDAEPRLRTQDLWIGLACLVAYLEVWSLFFPITAATLIAPCLVAALAGGANLRRPSFRPRLALRDRRLLAGCAVCALGVLWFANKALGKPSSYDSGLYHFSAIEYMTRFPAIPGLGNLHERLGAGDAHLLLVALMESGPWGSAGFHLANGLLVAMLLADITWRLVAGGTPPFTRRVALLLVPTTVTVIALNPGERLSSPSLDSPAFVLIAAGTLYLCQSLERFEVGAAMAATGAFATVAVTRPFLLPATILVGIMIVAVSSRGVRTLALISVIPAVAVAAWAARQAVLSGYPLFPLKIGALPVDWRMPGDAVDRYDEWVRSWARTPGENPEEVLGSWNWLPGWLRRAARNLDILLPLGLTLFALTRLRGPRMHGAVARSALAPLLLTLVIWFVVAPDPRFVYGPLWLVPILLLAFRQLDLRVAIVYTIIATAAVSLGGGLQPITNRGDGPFGSVDPPTPSVKLTKTRGGLIAQQPLRDDRCWRVFLCSPAVDPGLRSRGSNIAHGFKTS